MPAKRKSAKSKGWYEYSKEEAEKLDPASLLGAYREGTHVYVSFESTPPKVASALNMLDREILRRLKLADMR